MHGFSPQFGFNSSFGGGFTPQPAGYPAGIHSQLYFNAIARQGFNAAFGTDAFGNAPAGPVQHLVNRIASQLTGGNVPGLASLLPATNANQAQYFGPPNPISPFNFGFGNVPDQFQVLGLSNPNPLQAMLTSSWSIPGFGSVPGYAGGQIPLNAQYNPLAALRFWGHHHVSPYIQY